MFPALYGRPLSFGIRKLRFGRAISPVIRRAAGRLCSYGSHLAPSSKRFARFFSIPTSVLRFRPCAATAAEIPDMEGEIFAECGEIFPLSPSLLPFQRSLARCGRRRRKHGWREGRSVARPRPTGYTNTQKTDLILQFELGTWDLKQQDYFSHFQTSRSLCPSGRKFDSPPLLSPSPPPSVRHMSHMRCCPRDKNISDGLLCVYLSISGLSNPLWSDSE